MFGWYHAHPSDSHGMYTQACLTRYNLSISDIHVVLCICIDLNALSFIYSNPDWRVPMVHIWLMWLTWLSDFIHFKYYKTIISWLPSGGERGNKLTILYTKYLHGNGWWWLYPDTHIRSPIMSYMSKGISSCQYTSDLAKSNFSWLFMESTFNGNSHYSLSLISKLMKNKNISCALTMIVARLVNANDR